MITLFSLTFYLLFLNNGNVCMGKTHKVVCTSSCVIKYNGVSKQFPIINDGHPYTDPISPTCAVNVMVENMTVYRGAFIATYTFPSSCPSDLQITSFLQTSRNSSKQYRPLHSSQINGQYRLVNMCELFACTCLVLPEGSDVSIYNPFQYSLTFNNINTRNGKNFTLSSIGIRGAARIEGQTSQFNDVYVISRGNLWIFCGERGDIFVQIIPYIYMYVQNLFLPFHPEINSRKKLIVFSHFDCGGKLTFGSLKDWDITCKSIIISENEFHSFGNHSLATSNKMFLIWQNIVPTGNSVQMGFKPITPQPNNINLPLEWPLCDAVCSVSTTEKTTHEMTTNFVEFSSTAIMTTFPTTDKRYTTERTTQEISTSLDKSFSTPMITAFPTTDNREDTTIQQAVTTKPQYISSSKFKTTPNPTQLQPITMFAAYGTSFFTQKTSMQTTTERPLLTSPLGKKTTLKTTHLLYSTQNPTTANTCQPGCILSCFKNYSKAQVEELVEQLKKENEINKTTLSRNIRRLTSAKDDRVSAFMMGCFGVAIISIVVGFICVLDCISVFQYAFDKCHLSDTKTFRRPSTVELITRHQMSRVKGAQL